MKITRDKALVNVQAYFPDDKEIAKILNYCCLQPVDGWRVWQNSESFYLKIGDNKKIKIKWKPEYKINDHDLYSNSSPEKIAEVSRVALIYVGPDPVTFMFLGNDNIVRTLNAGTLLRKKIGWHRTPTLFYPLDDLRTLIKHENVESAVPVSCFSGAEAWVTPWPPTLDIIEKLGKEKIECNNLAKSLIEDFSVT